MGVDKKTTFSGTLNKEKIKSLVSVFVRCVVCAQAGDEWRGNIDG